MPQNEREHRFKAFSFKFKYRLLYFFLFSLFFCGSKAQINTDSLLHLVNINQLNDIHFNNRLSLIMNQYKNSGKENVAVKLFETFNRKIEISDFTKQKQLARNKAFLIKNLGLFAMNQGKYVMAQQKFFEAFNIYEALNLEDEKNKTLAFLANLYRLQKQPRKALKAYNQLLKNKNIPLDDEAANYNVVALIYDYDFNETDSALYFYNKALEKYKLTKNKRGISSVNGNISGALTVLKKYPEALKYIKISLKLNLELNDNEGQMYSYWGLAEIYDNMNMVDSAEANYIIALNIAKKLKLNMDILEGNSVLAEFYFKQKKYEKAYYHQTEAKNTNSEIYSTEMANSLNKMQAEFETEKKEQEIKLLQKDILITESNLSKQKQIIVGGIVVFILVLGLLIFIIKNNIERKKVNMVLSSQKIELEKLSIVARETNNSVIITDSNGDIIWVNSGFEKMHKKTLNEIFNTGITNVKELSSNENINEIFNKAVANHESINYTGKIFTDNEKNQWIQTTLTPIYKNNIIDKIVLIDSDITLLKEAEAEITSQRNLLNTKNIHINQSLDYAKKLQQTILPSEIILKSLFKDSFVYFKPKDIVSGDFYWTKEINGQVLFSVIDCTGHGVPGAFMTIFVYNLLETIVDASNAHDPAKILNSLNGKLYNSLNKGGEVVSDGMELMLCSLNKNDKSLIVSGACSSLFHVSETQLTEVKGDLIVIGKPNPTTSYTNQEIKIADNDLLFLFTDGYPDQKGGDKNKKFYYQPFRDLLIKNSHLSMKEQLFQIDLVMDKWKGNSSQMDDMCVFGIKF